MTTNFPLQRVHMEVAVRVEKMALKAMVDHGETLEKMLDSAQAIAEHTGGNAVNLLA